MEKNMHREIMGISFIVIIYMEIPNYDKKETTNNFKQLYDCMPDRCFRMLICGKTACGKTNTVLHTLIKPLIYYEKIFLYSKNLEKNIHISQKY